MERLDAVALIVAGVAVLGFASMCKVENKEVVVSVAKAEVELIPAVVEEPSFGEVLEEVRQANGIPEGLLEGVIMHESKFSERAINPEKALCKRMNWSKEKCASRGLMQVVYGWHKEECQLSGPEDLDNWAENIRCGGRKLGRSLRMAKGNVPVGVSIYNGLANVREVGKGKYVLRNPRYARAVLKEAKRFGYKGASV